VLNTKRKSQDYRGVLRVWRCFGLIGLASSAQDQGSIDCPTIPECIACVIPHINGYRKGQCSRRTFRPVEEILYILGKSPRIIVYTRQTRGIQPPQPRNRTENNNVKSTTDSENLSSGDHQVHSFTILRAMTSKLPHTLGSRPIELVLVVLIAEAQ